MVSLEKKDIMLTYSFTDIGSDTLYDHLYKCIKKDIISGILKPDYKLPSKRSFSKHLNISTITIENAYAQLLAEGFIYSLPKKGYFVARIESNLQKVQKIKEEVCILPQKQTLYFADFLSNHNNHSNFPFTVWTKVMREVLAEESEALMINSPCKGIIQLRQAIAYHLKSFRGMQVDPEQIIVGAGTEYLYGLLVQLLGRDKVFALENPGYPKLAKIYASNGATCKFIPLDNCGIDIGYLEESNAEILHISPTHHYPTGNVTPISRRYELLGWASKSENRYMIEDDYDSEFRLLGKPIPSLQSIDVMEKVIYMNTFTKSLASTIRISYMVLPKHLLERFQEKLGFYACTVSNFEQYTLAKFIQEGYLEKHINRMRNYYKNQRNSILQEIKESPFAKYVTIKEEDAGLHFLMEVTTKLSDEELMKRACEEGIRISCLSRYYQEVGSSQRKDKSKEHVLVMNYSGIESKKIKEAIERLGKCILGT